MMPDGVNFAELIWTITALIGAITAGSLCRDVVADARNPCIIGADVIRRRAARLCIAITGVFVITMLAFAIIGIVAMFQPQPIRESGVTLTQLAATIGFGVVELIIVAVCVYWRAVRLHARRVGIPPIAVPIVPGGKG